MKRVSIIGCSGSGKTTLGRTLAVRLGAESVDLDELAWEPNWTKVPEEEFHSRLVKALESPSWVTSGNYSRAQHIYLERAEVIIWLDYGFMVVLGRILVRTWRRALFGESCCNGNRETVRGTFSRDSVIWWMMKTHSRRRQQYSELFSKGLDGVEVVHHKSPRDTRRWLEQLIPDQTN